MTHLHDAFERSARKYAWRSAISDPARQRTITYGQLAQLADSIAQDLGKLGVERGHRVGLYAAKSIPSVAGILGTLKARAAYVPVDATAPAQRGADILSDCAVSAVIVERALAERLVRAWERTLTVGEFTEVESLASLGCDIVLLSCEEGEPSSVPDLAYILYTSGSTGKPKGVMHTHESAGCFVDWCSSIFEPTVEDRFSSHAPFHFDLSILDLYVPLSNGAMVVLIGEEDGKNPLRLASLIADAGITVWYSTPSVLRLLLEHGGLDRYPVPRLRLVLFAGEVFAPRDLRRLQKSWPGRRYCNLYGPTETNVCTSYEVIGDVPVDRVEPYPIGRAIRGDETLVVNDGTRAVSPGDEGELLVHGGTVMVGYWNRPDLNARSFYIDEGGKKWYRTGDLVRQNEDGDYVFLGRRDRMVKRRGYRVELGEIEAALYRNPRVREAAVISAPDASNGVTVHAFVCWADVEQPSTVALKRFCAENLPLYMVPDRFSFIEKLPKTSTDKIDYQTLKGLNV